MKNKSLPRLTLLIFVLSLIGISFIVYSRFGNIRSVQIADETKEVSQSVFSNLTYDSSDTSARYTDIATRQYESITAAIEAGYPVNGTVISINKETGLMTFRKDSGEIFDLQFPCNTEGTVEKVGFNSGYAINVIPIDVIRPSDYLTLSCEDSTCAEYSNLCIIKHRL